MFKLPNLFLLIIISNTLYSGPLHIAAQKGELDKVKELLAGTDVNERDKDQATALIRAATNGHLEVVQFLLEKGADIDAVDDMRMSALMNAGLMNRLNIVEELLKHGANPLLKNKIGADV